MPSWAISERIIEIIEIERYRHMAVGSLPFGLQKLVGFARALALEPSIMLLDDPMCFILRHEFGSERSAVQIELAKTVAARPPARSRPARGCEKIGSCDAGAREPVWDRLPSRIKVKRLSISNRTEIDLRQGERG